MEWEFWKRRKRPKKPKGPAVQMMPPDWRTVSSLPVSTVREVLGLQQLIGNQAVLRILAPNGGQTNADGTLR